MRDDCGRGSGSLGTVAPIIYGLRKTERQLGMPAQLFAVEGHVRRAREFYQLAIVANRAAAAFRANGCAFEAQRRLRVGGIERANAAQQSRDRSDGFDRSIVSMETEVSAPIRIEH